MSSDAHTVDSQDWHAAIRVVQPHASPSSLTHMQRQSMTPTNDEVSGLHRRPGYIPRILVVDDDPEVRRALRRQLYTRGYEVSEARCGSDGMEAILQDGPFDAVISDVDMPHGCGVALLYRLRGLNNAHARRFVFHSSHTWELACHRVPVVQRKGDIDAIEAALSQL